MKLFLLTLAVELASLTSAVASFNLVCSHSTLLIQAGHNGSLSCQVTDVDPSINSTFDVNVTKINYIHGNQVDKPIVQLADNLSSNKTLVIVVLFPNVVWLAAGNYSLEVRLINVMKKAKFTLRVYDVPIVPGASEISYFTNYSADVERFAFWAPDRNRYLMKVHYTASYRVQGCGLEGQTGYFECFATPDESSKYPDFECFARTLSVCKNSNLAHCKLRINLTATNYLGNSTTLSFISKYIFTAVKIPVIGTEYRKLSSTQIWLGWITPCAAYSYSYNVSYSADGQTNKVKTSYFLGSQEKAVSFTLKNLHPATNYHICVVAILLDYQIKSKPRCNYSRTKEAVPSKSPVITYLQESIPGKRDIRWKVKVFWKLPEQRFWNGKAFVIVEHNETRRPNDAVSSNHLSTYQKNYTLDDLYVDRDYLVKVKLCTKIGCRDSATQYISRAVDSTPKGSTTTATNYIIWVVVAVAVAIIFAVAIAVYKFKKRRYGTLQEEEMIGNGNGRNELVAVPPRTPVPQYESPLEHAQVYEEFTEAIDDENLEDSIEVDFNEGGFEAGQLQIRDGFHPVEGNENIELVS